MKLTFSCRPKAAGRHWQLYGNEYSNRAKNKAVSRVSVSREFKDAGELLGLTINTHNIRKSCGMPCTGMV